MRLLFLLIVLATMASCDKPDDIKQIRAVVDDLAERARAHDVSGMMEHATRGFTADPGDRDEQAVRPLLTLALRQYGRFDIEYPAPGIQLDAEAGTAKVSVPFLIVREGKEFPSARLAEIADDPAAWAREVGELVGDPYQLDLDFSRTPDGWKIRKASIDGFKRIDQL